MSRKVVSFSKFKDFAAKGVSKQTLASLLVCLRNVLELYLEGENAMKNVFVDDSLFLDKDNKPDHSQRVRKLAEIREDRKKKLLVVYRQVWEARNKNVSQENWLPEFKSPLDLFNNITETVSGETVVDDDNDNIINELNAQVEHYRTEYELKVNELASVDVTRIINTGIHNVDTPIRSEYKGNFKLDAKTPVFHSRLDEDIESWIIRIEASLTLANVPTSLWLTACYNYVEGIALQMVIAAKKDNKSWKDFKDILVKTFRPIYKDYDIRARLLKLKDVDSFDKYLHDFRTLTNQIPLDKLSVEDRLTLFITGLRPKTRNELLQKKVKSLDEAIDLANSMNSVRNQEKLSFGQVNYAKTQYNKFKIKTNISSKNLKCHRCGKLGHIKADCRVNMPGGVPGTTQKPSNDVKTQYNSNKFQKKPYNPALNFECQKCHKKGHYTSACHGAKKKASVNLLEVNIIEVEQTPLTKSSFRFIQDDHSIQATWRKYDSFLISSMTFGDIFCMECVTTNHDVNRQVFYPRRCETHSGNARGHFGHFEGIGIQWDTENEPWKSENLEMANMFKNLSVNTNDKFYQWYTKYNLLYVNELKERRKNLRQEIDDILDKRQKQAKTTCNNVIVANQEKPRPDGSSQIIEICNADSTSKQLWIVQGNLRMWPDDNRELFFNCVIDTGANTSIISQRVVEKWDIAIKKDENVRVRQADGSFIETLGMTKPIELRVFESKVTMSFLVIPNTRHDLLLGLDWQELTKCVLFPFKKSLRFIDKPDEYILTSETDIAIEANSKNGISDYAEWDDVDVEGDISWNWDTNCVIKPQAKLTKGENAEFSNLAKKIEKYIAKDISELGKCNIIKHVIHTNDEHPVFVPAYRKSQSERQEIKIQIEEMLQANIIRKSMSPWSSPVILVPKPNNTKRMCIDFRQLNKKTVQQNFPIPRILDILDRMNGSKYFSALDLKSGYWQVEMDPGSITKTAFSTQDGHFEFLRLPFGLKNAPADFSRMMYMTLGDLDFVEIYLDDVSIHSKTFKEHLRHIEIVMKKLAEANLKINHEKCTWCATEVKILGHIVSYNEIKMDPKKVLAIKEWKPPQNVKQVQQFLGLANYYRRFIKDFSQIAGPMFNLLKKDSKFIFDSDCLAAFNKLKIVLTSEPILRPPDFNKEFILYTDASGYCVGSVLGQKDDDGREYVIAYGSRMLKGAELHYSITEKECLSIIFSIKHFRVYLYGKKFSIITDHSALSWLMKISDFKSATARLARWAILLQSYEFEIIHRAGRIHSNVDVLSRPVLDVNLAQAIEESDDSYEKGLDIFEYEPLLYYIKFGKHISGSSSKTVRRVEKLSKLYRYNGTELTYKNGEDSCPKIVPPLEDRVKLIFDNHLIGHFAARSTYDRLAEKYYWKKMMIQIITVLKQCETCARNKKESEFNHPAIALKVTGLFDRVGIDLTFGLPESSEGYIGVMVITEALSKFPWAKPIRSKSAKEIANILKEYICIFGAPKTIVSDRGTEFNNEIVDTMLKNLGVEHRVTSSYNPRANGLTERANQSLISALRKHVETDHLSWPHWLDWVLFAYRTRVHTSTNFSPFEILFGRKANNFSDWRSKPDTSKILELEVRSNEIKNLFENTIQKAKINIEKSQVRQKITQDKRHNVLDSDLEIGTKVMVKNDDRLIKKLESKYRGPFTIVSITKDKNYILEDVLKVQLDRSVPLHKLKIVALEDKEPYVEIEKIISHKIVSEKPLYLVKWKGLDKSENSWVKPEDFASMKFVNDYLKSLDNSRKTRSKTFLPSFTFLQVISFMFLIFPYALCQDISVKDDFDFDFCPLKNDLMPINLNEMCTRPLEIDTNHLLDWFKKYYVVNNSTFMKPNSSKVDINAKSKNMYTFDAGILAKSVNTISGKAFQCKKIVYSRTWSVGFWGKEFKNDDMYTEKLDADSCWYLVNNNKCVHGNFVNQMNCDENLNCNYEGFPPDDYSWFRDTTKSFAHCYVSNRMIAENDLNSHIFNGFCKVSDWFCSLKDSIIVWHRDVVQSCAFKRVSNGNFRSNGNYFIESSQKLGFQFKKYETNCDVDMILTTEGLYIAPLLSDLRKLEKFKDFSDIRGVLDLLLADEDFKSLDNLEDEKYVLFKNCMNFQAILKLLSKIDGDFVRLLDYQDKEIIFYSYANQIFLPKCVKIASINLISLKECYEDIPMTFILNNKLEKGFLTKERVIRLHSKPITCPNFPKYVPLPYLNKTIVSFNQRIELIDTKNLKFEKFDYYDHSLYKNLSHLDSIVNGVDVLGQIHNLSYVTENGGQWLIIPGDDSNKTNVGFNFRNFLLSLANWLWFTVKLIFWILLALATLFVIYLLIKFSIKIYLARRKKSNGINNPRIYIPSPNEEVNLERNSSPIVRFKKEDEIINISLDKLEDKTENVYEGTSENLNTFEIKKDENLLKQVNSFKRNFFSYFPSKSDTSVNTLELTTLSDKNKKPFSKLNKKSNI